MGGSSSSPPPVANPTDVANQQQNLNILSGIFNQQGSMVSQSNPYGSLSYSPTGQDITATVAGQQYSIPTFQSNINLSPQQQALFNTYGGTQDIAALTGQNMFSNAYGMYNAPPSEVLGNITQGLSGQMMSGYLQQMNPFFQTQRNQELTQLYNQGLTPGAATDPTNPQTWNAFDTAMYGLDQSQANAVAGAAAQFQPQAFSEAQTSYMIPATLGQEFATFGQPTSPTGSLIQTPGFGAQAANYISAVNDAQNAQLAAYQAQLAQQSALTSGLFNLGGTVLGAGILRSGEFKKRILKQIDTLPNGIKLYEFEYIDDQPIFGKYPRYIGAIAREVREIMPEAVIIDKNDGSEYVNYNLVMKDT